jgi:GR25 family glycosyltransferase involved in LPS biosynthesis
MSASLLLALALTVSALDVEDVKPAKGDMKEKQKKLGSGPGEVCEVPPHFVRQVNPKSTRHWEDISGEVTLAEPKLKKIFYINLDKSVERKNETEENLARQFPGVPVERWAATGKNTAGNLLKDPEWHKKARMGGTGIGSIATWFSHYFLMKHISEMEDPNAVYIIFEDDVMMKRLNLKEDVMCQIKQLPADWDLFKFGYWGYRMEVAQSKIGYPTCGGEQINPYTCYQKGFQWNYMGNQGYAVRPGGAKAIATKLYMTAIMDVDGAMMPGGKRSYYSHPNTYVSKHTLIQHSWRHTSTRTQGGERKFAAKSTASVTADELPLSSRDEEAVEKIEEEDADLEDDAEGRETSRQQFKRLMAWKETVLDKYYV